MGGGRRILEVCSPNPRRPMPFRCFVLLLFFAAYAGCTTQRDTAGTEPDTTATEPDTTAMPMTEGPGGAPNIAVYLDGTWDLTLVPRAGGEPISGVWTVAEGGANRLATSTGLDAPVRVADRLVTGDVFTVTGVVETADGPVAFEASGTLRGHEMRGEATLEGLGTYELTGARRLD